MKHTARFPNPSIQKKFQSDLAKLPEKIQSKIMEAVAGLENNPRPFGSKPFKQLMPPLKLYEYVAQYRIRIGAFRVLYDVDDKRQIVWIFALRKRNEKTYL